MFFLLLVGKINDTIKGHWENGEQHLQNGHNGQRHLIVRSEKMRKLWANNGFCWYLSKNTHTFSIISLIFIPSIKGYRFDIRAYPYRFTCPCYRCALIIRTGNSSWNTRTLYIILMAFNYLLAYLSTSLYYYTSNMSISFVGYLSVDISKMWLISAIFTFTWCTIQWVCPTNTAYHRLPM